MYKLTLLLFFFLNFAWSQQNSIIVEYIYTNDHYSNIEYLYADMQHGVYVKPEINKTYESDVIDNKDGTYELPIANIKTASISHFMSIESDTIKSYTVDIDFKRYIVIDDKFKIDWKIDYQERKEIGGYNCFKASTTFRGRNYICYFTEDIPVRF